MVNVSTALNVSAGSALNQPSPPILRQPCSCASAASVPHEERLRWASPFASAHGDPIRDPRMEELDHRVRADEDVDACVEASSCSCDGSPGRGGARARAMSRTSTCLQTRWSRGCSVRQWSSDHSGGTGDAVVPGLELHLAEGVAPVRGHRARHVGHRADRIRSSGRSADVVVATSRPAAASLPVDVPGHE